MSIELQHDIEILDIPGLAKRLSPGADEREVARMRRWIHNNLKPSASQRIPHLRFGRSVRFEWNSVEMNAWIEKRRKVTKRSRI